MLASANQRENIIDANRFPDRNLFSPMGGRAVIRSGSSNKGVPSQSPTCRFGIAFGRYLADFAYKYVTDFAGLASVMIALVFLYWIACIFVYCELNVAISRFHDDRANLVLRAAVFSFGAAPAGTPGF